MKTTQLDCQVKTQFGEHQGFIRLYEQELLPAEEAVRFSLATPVVLWGGVLNLSSPVADALALIGTMIALALEDGRVGMAFCLRSTGDERRNFCPNEGEERGHTVSLVYVSGVSSLALPGQGSRKPCWRMSRPAG